MNSGKRFISQVERDRVEAKVETESRRRAGKTGNNSDKVADKVSKSWRWSLTDNKMTFSVSF